MGPIDVVKATTRLLESPLVLARPNAERVCQVFHDAIKIVYQRQKRLNKKQLKMKEVSSALILAETLHSRLYHFEAAGPLRDLFGSCDENRAYAYFEQHVQGSVIDKLGRTVIIDDDALRSIYKDAETGAHTCSSENYEASRGKRLPWMQHALRNCDAVYVKDEELKSGVRTGVRRTFIYPATVSIPFQSGFQTSQYVVIVRPQKSGSLKVITAYMVLKRNDFLRIIEPCSIVSP